MRSCRPVFFSITGAPSRQLLDRRRTDFPGDAVEANDFETLEIEVRFIGQGPNVQVSAVDIQAHIVDEEGYYAANPNDRFVVQKFHIELVANNIITSDSSIVARARPLRQHGGRGEQRLHEEPAAQERRRRGA